MGTVKRLIGRLLGPGVLMLNLSLPERKAERGDAPALLPEATGDVRQRIASTLWVQRR